MLVYRSAVRTLDVRDIIGGLEERCAALDASGAMPLDAARSLLIDAGELEAALVDAECPVEDRTTAVTDALNATARCMATLFARAWAGAPFSGSAIDGARRRLRALRRCAMPSTVTASVPEGFAYYGLFPETYLDAAEELVRRCAPCLVVVIGIRGIGTTLSAAVAAQLAMRGVAASRLTVRPRGHPFDRTVRLSPQLLDWLRDAASRPGTVFAIVDEGPGLSGSSMASVVECLTAIGVAPERIMLMPSWDPPAEALSNARARRVWPRHQKFIGSFDRAWLLSGRLARAFGVTAIQDLSAGGWRRLFYRTAAGVGGPPLQPQHERRKFLGRRPGGEHILIKFEGLDAMAAGRRDHAERLAEAGFAPPVAGFAHGFLATRWMDGRPLEARDANADVLRSIARYSAWRSRRERAGHLADPGPLVDMLRVNAHEGLGGEWGALAAGQGARYAAAVARAPAVRVDGRMSPHEWLRTAGSLTKTDGVSHHDDHFYPGAHDIAWDLAGACIEWDLDAPATRMLVREYAAASGDRTIEPRLRFMRAGYAAFRLGYTSLASDALGETPDGVRLRAATGRYAAVLRRELLDESLGGQSYAAGT
jgi:hypothetical protein